MSPLIAPTLDQFLIFVLVLTRISPLVMTVPLLGSRAIPLRIRAFLAVGLAVLVTPLYWSSPVADPGNLLHLVVYVAREAVLGLALGMGMMILFAGLQVTGQIIGQMSGMQLADVFSPSADSTVSVFSQLLDLLTLVIFVSIGGHRQVMGALLETFQWMPPGQVQFSSDLLSTLVDVTTRSFVLGIRAAGPMMVALLLAVLIMGLISRTLPQLNIIAVGFSLNAMIMLATLSISLGTAAWIFQEQVGTTVDDLRNALMTTMK